MEEKIEYNGYVINITQDIYAVSPDNNGDTELFLVGFHRKFSVERNGFDKDTVIAALHGGKDDPDAIERDENAVNILKKYHVFPLEAYIHSGVALYLGGEATTDREWDVSALGAVFVERSKENDWLTRGKAEKAARQLIETWNQYLSGDVWCVDVQDQDGESIDGSYGGSYGYNDAVQQAKECIDSLVGSNVEPPYLKKDARKVLSDNFETILSKFDDDTRPQIGRALQKAINNL